MLSRTSFAFALIAVASACCSAQADEWLTDLDKARQLAREKDRAILVHFYADWCGPCIMLRRQILDDTVFLQMADTSLVLVNADFPRKKKDQLSPQQQSINNALADHYNADGQFPRTLLLDADGKVLKTWDGNPGVKPEVFAKEVEDHVEADLGSSESGTKK